MSEQQETQQTANAQQNNKSGEGNAAKGGTQTTYTQEQRQYGSGKRTESQ